MSTVDEDVRQASTLTERGDVAAACAAWRDVLNNTHVTNEGDYNRWCEELAALYDKRSRPLSAGRIYEYLLHIERALTAYRAQGSPRDIGRVLSLGNRLRDAATVYRNAGFLGHAALAAEQAGQTQEALLFFEQLSRSKEATGERYLSALALLNAGRAAQQLKQEDTAQRVLATAMRLLEEEADQRELAGDRDGALRCFRCLIQIGRMLKVYEPLAEGFINCLRILRSKGDRFFVVQYYSEFIASALELNEPHAAADLYREGGEYAGRVGFYYADHFFREGGKSWLDVADKGIQAGHPAELIENSLLAAVGCFNRINGLPAIVDCYARLAKLELPEKKVQRYVQLAADLQAAIVPNEKPAHLESLPEYFRRRLPVPDIWIRDVIESESGADIPDGIGRLVGNHKDVWEVQRRKSLLLALAYDEHIGGGGDPKRIPVLMIDQLVDLAHPAAVRPLQAMFDGGDDETKAIIVDRCVRLKHREVFTLINRAIAHGGKVRDAAVGALRKLSFVQALDPLVRIFNSHEAHDLREACVRSIASIGTDEACEFLLDVLRMNTASSGKLARTQLEQHAQERMLSALQRNRRTEPDAELRAFIDRLIDKVRSQRTVV